MRVLSVSLQNFASYQSLEFDFTNQGLTLLSGPTGSGKSTLCDAIAWVVFGCTAKGGSVNEVLSWPGDKVTFGVIQLDGGLKIGRQRGPKAKDNDLYFSDADTKTIRGKDLNDTQRLINQRLGINADLYLAGAYYHEFSQTAQFFTTSAKNRRSLCEQIVDLSLPKTLQEKASARLKDTHKKEQITATDIRSLEQKLEYMLRTQAAETEKAKNWKRVQADTVKVLDQREKDFILDKAKNIKRYEELHLADLERQKQAKNCPTCGHYLAPGEAHPVHSSYLDRIGNEKKQISPYKVQLASAKAQKNPYAAGVKDFTNDVNNGRAQIAVLSDEADILRGHLADLEQLAEVIADFRSVLIKNTIVNIQDETNRLLSEHFDAEIRVEFVVQDADKLDVLITKNGNVASFTQLSKGQRQLLKLSFGVSMMKSVAQHHGAHFSQIFLDEALDGMSDVFKAKAFSLFESLALEHESVFVVDHSSDFKARFNNSYEVELRADGSHIEKA